LIDIHYSILIFFIGTLGGVGWFQDFMFFWFYIFVVLYAWVLPVSLSAEADAKALGDWPTSHNLSGWTGQSIRMDIGALGFVGRWGQRGRLLSSVAGRWFRGRFAFNEAFFPE